MVRRTPLPDIFRRIPLAHRGYHDRADGRPENSLAAVAAAVAAGYGIEIDLQTSSDNVPMVFHDYDLKRLTGRAGRIRGQTAAVLATMPLLGTTGTIPTLRQVLDLVDGRVPLLIEFKDQDGDMGSNVGPLEHAASAMLQGYRGPLAVMSFNPESVAALAAAAPDVPRGLTTSAFSQVDEPLLSPGTRARLRAIPDLDRVGADFISHDAKDLASARVAAVRATGRTILCWTVRSPEAERDARQFADNVTFESYAARIPAAARA